VTLGGEARIYYTSWQHSSLGRTANDDNNPLQLGLRLLADLHIGDNLRVYFELGDNREFGERFATGPNRNEIAIYQTFVDVTVPLGDGKLVGTREGLNMRFTH